MLGATYVGDGNDYATGNIVSVTGKTGTFTQGITYNYMYQQPPDNYVDYIAANTGTLIFDSQDSYGRAVCYAGPSNSYRSIYATLNFGALRNGTSTKQQLMTRYLQYLLPNVVAEEPSSNALRDLSLNPNPARGQINVRFALTDPGRVNINIYDIAGKKVRALSASPVSRGFHNLIWDGRDDQGRMVSNGSYVFRFETGGVCANRTVVLVK
jgi:hypothetical protein